MPTRLNSEEITAALGSTPAWERSDDAILRTFAFKNFAEALAFVHRVGELAEAANHHPDIDIRWNKVRLELATHSASGLTHLDFDLAAKIDALNAL